MSIKKVYYYEFKEPLGKIGIAERDGKLTDVFFREDDWEHQSQNKGAVLEETELIKRCKLQLDEYLQGERRYFELPLDPQGTDFRKKDWAELEKIPYGTAVSYKHIAEKLGIPKGSRAVGLANNRNPISIIIPCHRVIGANGALVGYGGGLDIKIFLLELEGCTSWKL